MLDSLRDSFLDLIFPFLALFFLPGFAFLLYADWVRVCFAHFYEEAELTFCLAFLGAFLYRLILCLGQGGVGCSYYSLAGLYASLAGLSKLWPAAHA